MILRRLRAAVPSIVAAAVAIWVALTVAAQAVTQVHPDAVSRGDLWEWTATVVAGLAGVYLLLQRLRDKRVDEQIRGNAAAIAELTALVREHHEDFTAHPASSSGRVDRLENKIDGIISGQGILREEFTALRREHELIRDTEMCLLRLRRDPSDSPAQRRSTDPPDFSGAKRGERP